MKTFFPQIGRIFRDELAECLRPWKLVTLLLGVALLILGSFYLPAPDWDIPISLIMPLITYLTAPWSVRVVFQRQWRYWPAMLFAVWFSVDGCYALYWYLKEPAVLAAMRAANFTASLPLYGICGVFWLYRGSLRDFFSELRGLGNAKPLVK